MLLCLFTNYDGIESNVHHFASPQQTTITSKIIELSNFRILQFMPTCPIKTVEQ